MKLPLTEYAKKEIFVFTVIWLILLTVSILSFPVLSPIPLIGVIFTLYFFRDPIRSIPDDDTALLSPADGKVVEISDVPNNDILKCDALKVGIFLSIFNVHINRAPYSGNVESTNYKSGSFRNALSHKSSLDNESNTIVINNRERGVRIAIKQIAGAIARRIVSTCKINDYLTRGQKFGMIKFGSRTEIYIPKVLSAKLNIKLGDKVKAGESIIALLNHPAEKEEILIGGSKKCG